MSGRLIITNKKSYTPWKPQNVEKVLRDERIQREKEEKQEQITRQARNQDRIEKMKRAKYGGAESIANNHSLDSNHHPSGMELHHVNLFQEEEERQVETLCRKGTIDGCQPKQGVMPVYLTGAGGRKEDSTLFYKRKDVLRKEIDDELKRREDPMRRFHDMQEHDDPVSHDQVGTNAKLSKELTKYSQGRTSRRSTDDKKYQHHGDQRVISDREQRKRERKESKVDPERLTNTICCTIGDETIANSRIEQLRLKRMKRDEVEQQREKQLRDSS